MDPLEPVVELVSELRSSPENVALIAAAAFGAYAILGPDRTLALASGLSLGAVALGLHRHVTRAVSDEKPNPLEEGWEIQTLIFDKHMFTQGKAVTWAKAHGFKATKVDVETNTYRLRQRAPGGYARLRTIKLAHGIQAVVGFKS